ncbi:hypothetical protein PH562_16605 [Rhizobium sp. CNPSo 4062]|uniref:hypothetical protein n=1 Tax=Rhizobium sp. CNPSo 4062 TaxID=3021410 RepID=UPI00254D8219|nr:hypothetical protein [Rhizobium sp. CNPSo 4062]MDK4703874.1 hypothetical protein [Rhizobium sp. CNPSo 4062]
MSAEAQIIPEDIHDAAVRAVDADREDFLLAKVSDNQMNLRKVAIACVEKAILAERERSAQPRKKIIEAMCDLPHSINDDRVEFRFDSRRSGNNALDQLLTALEHRFGAAKGGA